MVGVAVGDGVALGWGEAVAVAAGFVAVGRSAAGAGVQVGDGVGGADARPSAPVRLPRMLPTAEWFVTSSPVPAQKESRNPARKRAARLPSSGRPCGSLALVAMHAAEALAAGARGSGRPAPARVGAGQTAVDCSEVGTARLAALGA